MRGLQQNWVRSADLGSRSVGIHALIHRCFAFRSDFDELSSSLSSTVKLGRNGTSEPKAAESSLRAEDILRPLFHSPNTLGSERRERELTHFRHKIKSISCRFLSCIQSTTAIASLPLSPAATRMRRRNNPLSWERARDMNALQAFAALGAAVRPVRFQLDIRNDGLHGWLG